MKKKIYIKPENRGKFNATKERTGKTTEELTHSPNALTRKRAIFAQNATKWKHSLGGLLNYAVQSNNPKLAKMWVGTMKDGGWLDNLEFDEENAAKLGSLLGVVQKSVEGVNETIQTGKTGAANESTMFNRLREDTNPFMRQGGYLKRFMGARHEMGGIPVDSNMNVNSMTPDAEVEGNETGYQSGSGQPYIFSDRLFDASGVTFADKSKQIDKRYTREDGISKATKTIEMNMLSKKNDAAKQLAQVGEQIMMKCGGKIKQYLGGGQLPIHAPGGYLDGNPLKPFEDDPNNLMSSIDPFSGPYLPMSSLNDPMNSSLTGLPELTNVPRYNGLSQEAQFAAMSNQPATSYDDKELIEEGPFNVTGLNEDKASSPDTPQTNLNKIALGLKGSALVQSFIDSVRKPEQEKLQLNPNIAEVEQIMEGLGVDYTPALNQVLGARNAGISNARLADSYNTQAVLANKSIAASGRAAGDLKMREQEANVGIRAQEAQTKFQTGESVKNSKLYQQTTQSQNDAAQRGFVRDFYSNLSQIGSQFNKAQYVKDQIANNKEMAALTITEGLALLGAKYPEFGITDDLVNRLKSGKATIDEYIKFFDTVEENKTTK